MSNQRNKKIQTPEKWSWFTFMFCNLYYSMLQLIFDIGPTKKKQILKQIAQQKFLNNNDYLTSIIKSGDLEQLEFIEDILKTKAYSQNETLKNALPVYFTSRGSYRKEDLDYNFVFKLIKLGANLNAGDKYDKQPLHYASHAGHQDIIELLLNKGASKSIDAKDRYQRTPLSFACQYKHLEIMQLLFNNSADIKVKLSSERSLLHLACSESSDEIIKLLLEKNVNINAKDIDGKTPLHVVCQKGREKIIEPLLKSNANINAKDNDGKTPLHLACKEGREGIIEQLLNKGADINAKDNDGKTPLYYIMDKLLALKVSQHSKLNLMQQQANQSIVKLLLKNGAQFGGPGQERSIYEKFQHKSEIKTIFDKQIELNDQLKDVLIEGKSASVNGKITLEGNDLEKAEKLINQGAQISSCIEALKGDELAKEEKSKIINFITNEKYEFYKNIPISLALQYPEIIRDCGNQNCKQFFINKLCAQNESFKSKCAAFVKSNNVTTFKASKNMQTMILTEMLLNHPAEVNNKGN